MYIQHADGKATYILSDDRSDEERGEAVGSDDEAVDGGRAAFLFGQTRIKRREETDGEG